MLTIEEAKRIGLNACIDKLGRSFVQKYADSSTTAYAVHEDAVFCFVGVDNSKTPVLKSEGLVLDSTSKFPYSASCNVDLFTGNITFLDYIIPS